MPNTPESIVVDPSGRSMVVDILDARDDASITCYTTLDGGTAVTLPLTITDVTTFFLAASGRYKVSAKVAGREIAGDAAVALVECRYGIPVRVSPRVSTPGELLDVAAGAPTTLGASVAATTLGTVVKKVEVFTAAGTSLGFIAVYDAIT